MSDFNQTGIFPEEFQ